MRAAGEGDPHSADLFSAVQFPPLCSSRVGDMGDMGANVVMTVAAAAASPFAPIQLLSKHAGKISPTLRSKS